MANHDEIRPSLFLHFGGALLEPEEALLRWCQLILLSGPADRDSMLRAFLDSKTVPYAMHIERAELDSIIARGKESGHLQEESGFVDLTPNCRLEIRRGQERAAIEESHARQRFTEHVLEVHQTLTGAALEALWEGLNSYAVHLMVAYVNGLERPGEPVQRADEMIAKVFRPDHDLHDIAASTFPTFLRDAPAGKKMLAQALSHVIYAVRTTVSDEAAAKLGSRLKYLRLYLDTNVLLTLLGLRGDPEQEQAVRDVLKLACGAGFSLFYTKQTREEFDHALRRFKSKFDPTGGQDSAPEYVLRRSRPSIERAYFAQRSRWMMTLDEFVEHFRDLRERLKELPELGISQVHLSEQEEVRILESGTYAEAEKFLLAEVQGNYTQMQRQHDAFQIALVDSERSGQDSVSEVPSWLLTLHKQLIHVNRRFARDIPMILTVDAWVLYFRPLLPRVENFAEFFISLVSSNVFYGMDLSDHELELASQYLSIDVDRSANDVIRRRFGGTPIRQLERVIRESRDTSELLDKLDSLERAREDRIARYSERANELRTKELESRLQQASTQIEDAKRVKVAATKAHSEVERELRLLQELANRNEELEKLDRAKDNCVKKEFEVRANIAAIANLRKTRAWAVGAAAVVVYMVVVQLIESWVPEVRNSMLALLAKFGLPLVPSGGFFTLSSVIVGGLRRADMTRLTAELESLSANQRQLDENRRELMAAIESLRTRAKLDRV